MHWLGVRPRALVARRAFGLLFAAAGLFALAGSAVAGNTSYTVGENTPGFIKKATDKGAADPSTVIDVTVWLKTRNNAQLNKLVQQQRQSGSPNYRKWIDPTTVGSTYAPTSQEANAVSNFLNAHGLTVNSVGDNNMYVQASGQIGTVEKAFHVQIDTFTYQGQTYYSNLADPNVNDSSGAHIAAIEGLDNFGYQPNVAYPTVNGERAAFVPLTSRPNGTFFSSQCFRSVETRSFTSADGTRTATYTGNRFGQDITNTTVGNLPPCGYNPAELHNAYDLNPLYAQGLNGSGQTVVITDAFGSATIRQDAELFSQINGLPDLTSSNFRIFRAPGVFHNGNAKFAQASWQDETTLDVEWVHAIAPGANIDLVLGPTPTSALDQAINYAIVHHLGNVITNSWGSFEGLRNPATMSQVNTMLEQAAAEGIDINFSSGDFGDSQDLTGFKTVQFPSSSPFATGVGGTSLSLKSDGSIDWQTGWGTNITRIALGAGFNPDGTPKNAPATAQLPPLPVGQTAGAFDFGAGGGPSLIFQAPSFQSSLGQTMREVPDVGWLADPFTGVEIVETVNGQTGVTTIGGTSLAVPMFSALMAIASQKAGGGLGQVAPLLYNLPAGAITDVTQATFGTNVTGSVTNPAQSFSAAFLAGADTPRSSSAPFISAIYNSPFSTNWFTLAFGTDTTLAAAPGWDDVTGVGTPDGTNLVNAIG